MNRRTRRDVGLLAVLALLFTGAQLNVARADYGAALRTPTPPAGASTFSWETRGTKAGPGRGIGHVELSGCWTAAQVVSLSAVDSSGAPVAIQVHTDGPKANAFETADVAESRLPLQITATFNTLFGSTPTGTDLYVKTGGGSTAGPHLDVGGPTCAPPDDGESIEEASLGELALANLSPTALAPLGSPVRFELTGATLSTDPTDVRVFRNGVDLPASRVQLDGNAIVLNGALGEGRNHFVVLGADSEGKALSAEVTLWAGGYTLYVSVRDEQGQPADGALVSLRLGDDKSVGAESTSSGGLAIFSNLPNWTVLLEARASGNRFATVATYGAASSALLRLLAFSEPSPIANNDFSQGLEGWNTGSAPVQLVPHVEEGGGSTQALLAAPQAAQPAPGVLRMAPPRDGRDAPQLPLPTEGSGFAALTTGNMDLALNTAGEGPQSASRTFAVAPGTSSVRVRFRFITTEVPGGWFGTQYNDYFSVSVRSQGGGGANADSNSMNGLGLGAFDGSGATGWREVTLPVNEAGDTMQVDLTVANVADAFFPSQVVVDVVDEERLRITSDRETACPNQTITFRPEGSPDGTLSWSGGGTPATGSGNTFPTRFAAAGRHTVQATLTGGSGTQTASRQVRVKEASGAAWVARFPTSRDTADLVAPFQGNVDRFISALGAGGAAVRINATLRPVERAYMMHYSFRIAREGLDPAAVPAMEGVDICWVHRDANGNTNNAAARAAAQAMVNGFEIVHRPALQSRHTQGRAIDMNISWTGNLTLNDGAGTAVTITTTPRTGAGNAALHGVGGTYAVRKLAGDPPHWSDDGH
jgi:hypothetical protein